MGAQTAPIDMSSPPSSTHGKQGWKSRFGRRGSKSPAPEQAADEEKQVPTAMTSPTTKSNSGFKKKMSGRLGRLLTPTKKSSSSNTDDEGSPSSNPQSPPSKQPKSELYEWQDEMEQQRAMEQAQQKQSKKERDGFCRRVGAYDGQVITVEGKPAYELGNYLGGGVAGVVYEGNRLLPDDCYPVRSGEIVEEPHVMTPGMLPAQEEEPAPPPTFLCVDTSSFTDAEKQRSALSAVTVPSLADTSETTTQHKPVNPDKMAMEGMAIETTASGETQILVDRPDAPSRSKHAAQAAAKTTQFFMEDTVAIKILNPVGFRILSAEQCKGAVVVRQGQPMPKAVQKGKSPMQDKHVWWLVNPSSRNLQTLQRYNQKNKELTAGQKKTRDIDRGSAERGLRLSLVAAFQDANGNLRELPLTRCIEIWGHMPFSASDQEFEEMIDAIERVNAGQEPPPPSRVPTDSTTSSNGDVGEDADSILSGPVGLSNARTGLFRAATKSRQTVFCEELNAYIALPEVPPKYLRWLRQRRAATKEIRNMMLIGRHRNVVHLYEVLEYIQDSKSTMFLILELVRGGELFDLISSGSSKKGASGGENVEAAMRKFFIELASGIRYCHVNGIAHRDLKPENLLVHNAPDGEQQLKIADFGLSATFMENSDQDTVTDSVTLSPTQSPGASPVRTAEAASPSVKTKPENSFVEEDTQIKLSSPSSIPTAISTLGVQALQFLTCGNMEDVAWCAPGVTQFVANDFGQPQLRRMTSVVGSPHYVAPEIISQTGDSHHSRKDKKKNKPSSPNEGYDGTKADVWSAGVILYAMLFRSLPFGEDLLRCPRYQSFRKWYKEARQKGNRRATALSALGPITEKDEDTQLGPHWFFPSETSKESRDLIVAMLNPDADERLTIDMVLQHAWTTKRIDGQ